MKNLILLRLFLILSFVYTGISLSGQSKTDNNSKAIQYLNNRNEVYFSFSRESHSNITDLSNIISIDKVDADSVYAYANNDMFFEFIKTGISFNTLTPPSLLNDVEMTNNTTKAKDWNSYPTYDAYIEMMNQFATNYPDICSLEKIGESINGRDILVVKISDNVSVKESEPEFFYSSTMHGDELTGMILSLRLIDNLITQYGINQRATDIVNNLEIWINPLANPDGTYFMGDNTIVGATRFNAAGVDLNRNFPDPENGLHPDGYPWQIETIVMMDFMNSHNFILAANIHTGYEVINYPWDTWPISHSDDLWYEQISRQYADTAQAYSGTLGNYLMAENNGITNGYEWYSTNGSRQDYMNYFRNSREVTIELSYYKTPSASLLPAYWEANYRSLYGYMEQCYTGIYGNITDSVNGLPILGKIEILNHDFNNSEIYSEEITGYYQRLIYPGIYDIKFSSPGYREKIIENIQVNNNSSFELNVPLFHIPMGINSQSEVFQKLVSFPNPVISDFSLFFVLKRPENISIDILDINGKKVLSVKEQQYSIGLNEVKINIDNLASGTYIVKLITQSQYINHKISKL